MINIYFLIEGNLSTNYGIGTYINSFINISKNLDNFNVNIIALKPNISKFSIQYSNGINYFNVPYILTNDDNSFTRDRYYQHIWFLIYPFIKQEVGEKNILHINNWICAEYISLYKKYIPNGKVCFTIHYFDWCFQLDGNIKLYKELINSYNKGLKEKFDNELRLLNSVDAIIALSHYTKKILIDIYKQKDKKIYIINNGISEATLPKIDKNLYGFLNNDIIVSFVGRLDKSKGLEYIIKGFKLALEYNKKLKLLIIGDGDFNYYMDMIYPHYNNIYFLGKIKKNNLNDIYSITDIGILLSYHEQCSYTIIEMLMYGIPVISSNAIGINEMIFNKYNGLIIPILYDKNGEPYMDIKLISKKIITLAKDKNLKNFLSKNSRNTFKKKYTLFYMQNQLLSLYSSL